MTDKGRLLMMDIGTALAVVLALLLAFELFGELDSGSLSSQRWRLLVLFGTGAGLSTAIFSDRLPARPLLIATGVLAWPVLALFTNIPGPPAFLPLFGDTGFVTSNSRSMSLAVGVLGGGAWLRR